MSATGTGAGHRARPGIRRRVAATVLTVAAGGLLSSGAFTAPASACVPHVEGYGPTVTVAPDYAHPANSDVTYDSSDFDVQVVTCVT